MARRRRKRLPAKSGAQTHGPRAPIAEGSAPDTESVEPPSSSRKRHKRPISDYPSDGEKRQKVERVEDQILTENMEQENEQDTLTRLGSAVSPNDPLSCRTISGDGRTGGQRSHVQAESESPILVTCGRNEGHLYLSKLRVVVNERCRTKCIRTGNTWWTPNEFQFVSGRGAAKDWKRTVKHSGQCLKVLLTSGVICLASTPPRCLCKPCDQTETGKTSVSSGKQKEQEEERNYDDGDSSEIPNVADRSVNGVKVRSKGHEVKRSGIRLIKIHRRGRRHERKRGPIVVPAKKKSRNPDPESEPDVGHEERQDDDESRPDLQEPRSRDRERGSLVLRLSSASFKAVACSPDDVIGCSPSRRNSSVTSEGALKGRHSDQDATEVQDEIPDTHSTCKRLSDDVTADVTDSFGRGSDVKISLTSQDAMTVAKGSDESAQPLSPVTSSPGEEAALEKPEVQPSTHSAHAKRKSSVLPEANRIDWTSADSLITAACYVGSVKNSSGNVVTDRANEVTIDVIADVISPPSLSTVSVTTAPRKNAYLDAVIAELKRKKKSREAGAVVPPVPLSGGENEGQRKAGSPGPVSSSKVPPTAESMKSEINFKTIDDHTVASSVPAPVPVPVPGEALICSDTKPSCLKPTRTGDRTQDPENRFTTESKAGVSTGPRRTDSSGRRRKLTTPTFSPVDHASWGSAPSKISTDEKDEGLGSIGGGKFRASGGNFDPKASFLGPANAALNLSQLASIYGLNASPLTSLPLPQPPFPFFPPYLFMGFPLQPLLPPQFSSLPADVPPSASENSLPATVPRVSSAISGSTLNRKRHTQQSYKPPGASSKETKCPQGSSSLPDHFTPLRKTTLPTNHNLSDLHLWRHLATDFSAQSWATGNALAVNSTGNGKSHSGSACHPIWRPGVLSQSATSRESAEQGFKTTVTHRPFAHTPKQVTSTTVADRYKSESSLPLSFNRKLISEEKMEEQSVGADVVAGNSRTAAYSCDDQGVLDLSKK